MIYLSTTQSNTSYFTLYENCSNVYNPYFTFKLINCNTNAETIFYQDDTSLFPYNYNTFTISIGNPEGLTAGILNITKGQYNYFVYEMANKYDLNINNAINLVETGILNVIGTQSSIQTYTGSNTYIATYNNI